MVHDAIQPSNDPLEVPVGPITRLRAKKLSMNFKRIFNKKEQALINLIHVQKGLRSGTKSITQGLGEED